MLRLEEVTPQGDDVVQKKPSIAPEEVSQAAPVARSSWRPIATWTAAGVAALGLGFGITQQLRASSKYEAFNSRKDSQMLGPQCSTFYADKGGAECRGLLAAGDDAQTLALVGFVAAGVSAGVAAVLLWTDRPSDGSAEKISAVLCVPGFGSLNCGGRF